ncbi:OmpA family protein [Vibrio parahaemolyticus]|uniref:OmpA family protein n=1 Tax=Vibrio parahaemolyticus TaxID=670 RepID=UPI001EEA3E25|nr:OmpA family protein [Vibrio parahaemolyticus]EKK9972066.1 OmpA family protein [Vibrio parahaemolyticus]MCG6461987.1 OmpA family protein [Vibrio parahaemolyticus]
MKSTPLLPFLVLSLSFSSSIFASTDSVGTFYLGGNLGGDVIDGQFDNTIPNPISFSTGIVGGVNINQYLALETDFSYFGSNPSIDGNSNLWGLSGYLMTRYKISDKAGLYFKLGASTGRHDWSPSAGVGVHYRLAKRWLLDVGYRWIDDVPDVNGDLYEFAVGGRYLFGVEDSTMPPLIEVEMPKPEPKPIPKEVLVTINAGTLFGFDSVQFEQNATIDSIVKDIRDNDVRVSITGHTDSSGPSSYNVKLSQRRADAVKQYMIQRGVPSEHITTQGLGESMPIMSNESAEGRALNRRIDIRYEITAVEH